METQRKELLILVDAACRQGARKGLACELLGLSIRTLQRWEKADNLKDKRLNRKCVPANKLSEFERSQLLNVVNQARYATLPPNKIVPLLADEGRYLASESTFYRVLKAQGQLSHRNASRLAKARHKPKALVATQPNEIYSWDISYLASEVKGLFFYLYLMMDIYSRKIVGWQVHDVERSEHAANLLTDICLREGVRENQVTLHSDNGSPMKGATMLATLQQLGVIPSFSRPAVSNDNPYSESLFKTLKYRPEYPQQAFVSLESARDWVADFVQWYNEEHLHSGIKFVTPCQRHQGEDHKILAKRHQIYQQAKAKNPLRWSGNTRNWTPIKEVNLNPDKAKQSNIKTQMAA